MKIIKTTGQITKITELSPTARDIEIKLAESLKFIPGNFVNVFMDIDGEKIRRAYSISSSDQRQNIINISVRLTINGKMTPQFWKENIVGTEIELMGPLGLNTADKMLAPNKYLIGFGIGAGVVKSLLDYFERDKNTEKVFVILGHRNEKENIHNEYFTNMMKKSNKIKVEYVFSKPDYINNQKGYIQDHISKYNFSNSDIYVCGQEEACKQLLEKINFTKPKNTKAFVEAFH